MGSAAVTPRDRANRELVGDLQELLRGRGHGDVDVDEWAGRVTRAALEAELGPLPARRGGVLERVDRSLRLPEGQWVGEWARKDLIVLHHTAGGTARSTVDWWSTTRERIGTAYLVERDGTIHEVYPPEAWAYHIGAGDVALERRSIGIELASEGGLLERDGRLYAFGVASPRTEYRGDVWALDRPWRGYRDFAAYTEPAIAAALDLVAALLAAHDIPRRTPRAELAAGDVAGVVAHAHLRADKSDVHPGFPWPRLVDELGLEVV